MKKMIVFIPSSAVFPYKCWPQN